MYTKLSLCFITLSLATIVGNCAPVTSVPVICQPHLEAIRRDIIKLQQILPNNGARLDMPKSTRRPCARATIEHFKKELDVLVQENVGEDNILNITRNIQDNIDAAWKGIEEEGNEEESQELLLEDAFQEIKAFLQQCYNIQTNSTSCNN